MPSQTWDLLLGQTDMCAAMENNVAEFGCCPGTGHCTENGNLKATIEKQRLRIDHQTIEIRVRVPAFLTWAGYRQSSMSLHEG